MQSMQLPQSPMNSKQANPRVECLKLIAEGASVSITLFPVNFVCI